MKDRDPRADGEIKHKLFDLIDIDKIQALTDSFCEAVGIASAIIDLEGTVLISSRWQKICTDFHRVNPDTCRRCIESDTILANQLLEGGKYAFYKCQNGLRDAAMPIVIEGEHIANFFIGQFLVGPPEVEYFRNQAREYGFNETSYLKALSQVPIIAKERIKPILVFFSGFAELLGEMGLKQIKQLEVTEALRESEIRFRTLVEHLPASTYTATLDESSTTLYISPQIEETLGISPEEYKTAPNFWVNHLHDEDSERVLKEVNQSHETGQPFVSEYRMISTDGRIVWLRDEAVIIKDDKGNSLYLQGVMFDITERKQTEEELAKHRDHLEELIRERTAELDNRVSEVEQLNIEMVNLSEGLQISNKSLEATTRQLTEANKELEAFAYSVSHDLRAPLRNIDGFSQILLEDYSDILDKQGRHYLQRVRAGTQNMGQLIDDILSLSRSGRHHMDKKTINMESIVREVCKSLENELKDRKVDFVVHECPPALADSHFVKIVLTNLLSNALKFTKIRENAKIETGSMTEDDHTVFFIKDNGAGLP